MEDILSLIPRPSITAIMVEGLVKLIRRMTSGRHWEAWHFSGELQCYRGDKPRLPMSTERLLNVILCRSFTRPSTALAVIEGLGTRLEKICSSVTSLGTRSFRSGNETTIFYSYFNLFILVSMNCISITTEQ